MDKNSKIYIAGHRGLAGSAITRELINQRYTNLVYKTSEELDLRNQKKTEEFLEEEKPEYVFVAAARVGGLNANNTLRGEFIYDNLQIQNNVIHSSFKSGVKKLMFLGSNCIYPKDCAQPMKEEYLLTGPLEPTNQPYAVAKIAGVEMCNAYMRQYGADFISVIPASLFGPHDNYDGVNSHIIPTLIMKCHEAKLKNLDEIVLSGSKNRRREMLYSDDMANASVFLMNNYSSPDIINIGTGIDHSIEELANMISEVVGFKGTVKYDTSKPDGMKQKLLDVEKLKSLGWNSRTDIKYGLIKAYDWFVENKVAKLS